MRAQISRAHGSPTLANRSVLLARRPRAHASLRLVCSAADQEPAAGAAPGLLLEADGALMDTHGEGHRVAFNRAFAELGYECVNWNSHIYFDLLRMGDGTGPGVIRAYYELMGWPMMVPTKERPAFVRKVYETKCRVLKEMVAAAEIPLRPGVLAVVDDALADGARIAVLAGTASAPGDSLVSSAMFHLGPSRAMQMRVVTVGADADAGDAADSESEGGGPPERTFEQGVAAAQAKAKSSAAKTFTKAFNLQSAAAASGIGLDPKLLASWERSGLLSPQLLAAVVAVLGSSAAQTSLVAANHSTMEAGQAVGLLVASVPPSVTKRGGYTSCDASFDGYGAGGGLTWRKLKFMLEARNAKS